MAKHRSHSVAFKRQVAQEFLGGETLHGLANRHDLPRNLIRIWVEKYEARAFDEDAAAADLVQGYEARIAALERLVGNLACAGWAIREADWLWQLRIAASDMPQPHAWNARRGKSEIGRNWLQEPAQTILGCGLNRQTSCCLSKNEVPERRVGPPRRTPAIGDFESSS